MKLKRLVSTLLLLTMLFSVCIPAAYADTPDTMSEELPFEGEIAETTPAEEPQELTATTEVAAQDSFIEDPENEDGFNTEAADLPEETVSEYETVSEETKPEELAETELAETENEEAEPADATKLFETLGSFTLSSGFRKTVQAHHGFFYGIDFSGSGKSGAFPWMSTADLTSENNGIVNSGEWIYCIDYRNSAGSQGAATVSVDKLLTDTDYWQALSMPQQKGITLTFDDDFTVVIGVDAGTDGWQSAESEGSTSETGSSWG